MSRRRERAANEKVWALRASLPTWHYDETQHAGVDYSSVEEARRYDEMHQRFRDYAKSAAAIVERLGIGADDTVIDMGAGTGAFAIHVAKGGGKVYAVDVSEAMLTVCREKAEAQGLSNIEFCVGGFLTYGHAAEPCDAMVSVAALHHLPDFWKLVGLCRAAGMLKPGGKLFLFDVVFPAEPADLSDELDRWVESIRQSAGSELAAEAEVHIREEHSTYDWVMEGILERAGFSIENADYADGFRATYVCKRL